MTRLAICLASQWASPSSSRWTIQIRLPSTSRPRRRRVFPNLKLKLLLATRKNRLHPRWNKRKQQNLLQKWRNAPSTETKSFFFVSRTLKRSVPAASIQHTCCIQWCLSTPWTNSTLMSQSSRKSRLLSQISRKDSQLSISRFVQPFENTRSLWGTTSYSSETTLGRNSTNSSTTCSSPSGRTGTCSQSKSSSWRRQRDSIKLSRSRSKTSQNKANCLIQSKTWRSFMNNYRTRSCKCKSTKKIGRPLKRAFNTWWDAWRTTVLSMSLMGTSWKDSCRKTSWWTTATSNSIVSLPTKEVSKMIIQTRISGRAIIAGKRALTSASLTSVKGHNSMTKSTRVRPTSVIETNTVRSLHSSSREAQVDSISQMLKGSQVTCKSGRQWMNSTNLASMWFRDPWHK